MKATGMVRYLDQLGRIVIPKEQRLVLGIDRRTPMEIFLDDEMIILRKYVPGCIFCQRIEDTVRYMDKRVCPDCIERLGSRG